MCWLIVSSSLGLREIKPRQRPPAYRLTGFLRHARDPAGLLLTNKQRTHSTNHASNHPSIQPSVCTLTHTFIHPPIHSPTISFIHHPSVHSPTHSFIHPSKQLSIYPSTHPSVRPNATVFQIARPQNHRLQPPDW